MCVCVYVCMCVCVYVCMFVHDCVFVRERACSLNTVSPDKTFELYE